MWWDAWRHPGHHRARGKDQVFFHLQFPRRPRRNCWLRGRPGNDSRQGSVLGRQKPHPGSLTSWAGVARACCLAGGRVVASYRAQGGIARSRGFSWRRVGSTAKARPRGCPTTLPSRNISGRRRTDRPRAIAVKLAGPRGPRPAPGRMEDTETGVVPRPFSAGEFRAASRFGFARNRGENVAPSGSAEARRDHRSPGRRV